MKLLFTLLLVMSATMWAGCEGYRCGKGKVVDKNTGRRLDSVLCEVNSSHQTIYTDSTGKFELCNPFGGCVPACKDIIIQFSKTGYKTQSIENPTGAVISL